MEQIMANEEVMEVAEAVAEDVVETKPKFDLGKAALGAVLTAGAAIGVVKLVKFIKAKAAAKKAEKVEPATEEANSNWVEELDKAANEPMIDGNPDA